jgi:hypothetical protein
MTGPFDKQQRLIHTTRDAPVSAGKLSAGCSPAKRGLIQLTMSSPLTRVLDVCVESSPVLFVLALFVLIDPHTSGLKKGRVSVV